MEVRSQKRSVNLGVWAGSVCFDVFGDALTWMIDDHSMPISGREVIRCGQEWEVWGGRGKERILLDS